METTRSIVINNLLRKNATSLPSSYLCFRFKGSTILQNTSTNRRWRIAQAAEIRWWRAYLGRQDWPTYLKEKQAGWNRLLQRLEMVVPEEVPVLDAGCGPAGIFMVLKKNPVDALDPLLGQYQRHISGFDPQLYLHVHFLEQPLETLENIEKYAVIFCINAINHVADLDQSLTRLYRAGKPGSTLVLSSDLHRWRFLRWIFRLLPGDVLHPQQHNLADYRQLLTRQGWQLEKELLIRQSLIFDYWVLVLRK